MTVTTLQIAKGWLAVTLFALLATTPVAAGEAVLEDNEAPDELVEPGDDVIAEISTAFTMSLLGADVPPGTSRRLSWAATELR